LYSWSIDKRVRSVNDMEEKKCCSFQRLQAIEKQNFELREITYSI